MAEYGPGFEMAGGYRYGPILAGKRHAVGSLSAYADVGGVAGIALATRIAPNVVVRSGPWMSWSGGRAGRVPHSEC